MSIRPGDRMPAGTFRTPTPEGIREVQAEEFFRGRNVLLFAVPGAFTPTCSAKHLPGYLEHQADFRARGIDVIACLAVNDAFVMQAWAKAAGAEGKVVMLADGNGDYTRALGLELDARGFGMGMRSKRFAILVRDGIATQVHVEEGGEFRVSSAAYLLERL